MKLGVTVLRAALGAVFFAHGTQKLFGWFGGPGLKNAAQAFDSMGLKPGKRTALAAGTAEAGSGTLFALGLMMPVASAAAIGVMGQAVRTVHWKKGFFASEGGYEFNMTLTAAAMALADVGPGRWSLDEKLGIRMSGPVWALAALGAGLAGPQLLERLAPSPDAQAPAPQTVERPEAAPEIVGS
jgi:putative oxidoreductase